MKLHLPKALLAALLLTVGTVYADYTWIGGSREFSLNDQTGWNSASNWEETIPSGVTVAWTGNGNAPWQKMIFDAEKQADGTLTLTTCKLEGWALKMDVLNGANVTVQDLVKLQGDCAINVDGTSTVTIKKKMTANSGMDDNNTTFNLGTSVTGTTEKYAAQATLILGRDDLNGNRNTIVNYGEINGTEKVGFFTLSSDGDTNRNHSGSLVLQASLTQTIVSKNTTLHTIELAEVSHITFSQGKGFDFSGITSENFLLSTDALSQRDEDIGKYYVWNDGGTIKLSYVTGDVSIKRANVAHGSSCAFTALTDGESDVAALYLTVDPTPAPNGAATVNVTADSTVTNKLSVAGGTASVSVAEGATLTVGNFSLADADSKLNFTGAGKVIMTQDVIFGNLTGANGTPAQASDFTGLGTLELAENVTLYMGTNDGGDNDRRVGSVNLADNVIMKDGSKLSINATTAEIASNFVMTNATIDYTDLASAGVAKLNGNIELHGANTVNAGWIGSQEYQLNGDISGAGSLSLTKGNGSTETFDFLLSGTNTYSGGTTIASDVAVKATNGSAFGTGSVANSGTIIVDTEASATVSNNITGSGTLTVEGTGAKTFSGTINANTLNTSGGKTTFTNTITATTINTAGTVNISGNIGGADNQQWTIKTGSEVTFTGNRTVDSPNTANSRITVEADATLDASAGRLWSSSDWSNGSMHIYGTLVVKDMAYNGQSFGQFRHDAGALNLYGGSEIVITNGTTQAAKQNGNGDQHGFTLKGTDDATYTLTYRDGANSYMTFMGGLAVDDPSTRTATLKFNTEGTSEVHFTSKTTDGTAESAYSGFAAPGFVIQKTGDGTMYMETYFKGAVEVAGGKFVYDNTRGTDDQKHLTNLKLTSGTAEFKQNATVEALSVSDAAKMDVKSGTVTLSGTVSLGAKGEDGSSDRIKVADGAEMVHDSVTYSKGAVLGNATADNQNFSLLNENVSVTGGKISIAAGQGTVSDRNIGAALNGTDVTYTADGYVAFAGTQRIGALEATQGGRTLYVGGTRDNRTAESNVTVDSISGFSTITVENVTVAGTEKKSSFTVNNLGTVKQNGGTAAKIEGAALAGSTDSSNASIAGTSTTELAKMTTLSLDAAVDIDIRNATLYDSTINAGSHSITYSVEDGSRVKAVAATATETGTQLQARAFGPAASGDLEGGNSATAGTLTATAVQTGGSASGKLTVDVDKALLTANPGKTLEWTIFSGVDIAAGFVLDLGDILSTIVDNGKPVVSLKVNDGEAVAIKAADISTPGYNLLAIPEDGMQNATVVLIMENIPEPATGTLSVLALAALAARRRRGKKN